jgi:hypothetical protein
MSFLEVARATSRNNFENQGSTSIFCGLRLDFRETEGPLCKILGIIEFWIYF